jgi:hypothetical protein
MTPAEAAKKIADFLGTGEEEAEKILDKSVVAGELAAAENAEPWIEERLKPNTVFIDEAGYSKMCIDALKILKNTAATDYGSSRMRDLGQLWADMTRGYLGELAFSLFMKARHGLDIKLGHERGTLEEYLPTDIHGIVDPATNQVRQPNIRTSVKSTKLNGIWLDIPGAQFGHSDAHILVKLGTGRDHLFAFFKSISVFRDKVLKTGRDQGQITEAESEEIWNNLPSFTRIPAYISGYVPKDASYSSLSYDGKKGKKHFTVTSWNGPIVAGDTDRIKRERRISGNVKFEGIGEFAHDSGYLFSTGKLLWSDSDWKKLVAKL